MKRLRNLQSAAALTVAILLLVALGSLTTPVYAGGTVTNCTDDSDFSTKLSGGGTITFSCGTATIPWSSTKYITTNTTIDGGGTITLSGGGGYRLFVVSVGATLTLKNITLTFAYNPDANGGAGVFNNGQLNAENVTFHSMVDSAFNGGAISTSGPVLITNSTFYENKASNGAVIYANGGAAIVSVGESTFYNNLATGKLTNGLGGAIYLVNGAKLALENSVFHDNDALYGGAIYVSSGTSAQISIAQFNANFADFSGGAIMSKGSVTLSRSTLYQNTADYGAGITNDHGTLTVENSLFSQNSANVAGGGGIGSSFGPLTVRNSTFVSNFASGDAGGVENGKATATLENVTFSDNYAFSGGGMWNLFGGTAYLNNVTFAGNHATTAGGLGNSNDVDTHLYLRNVLFAPSASGGNCVFQKAPDQSDHNLSSDGSCNFGTGRDNVTLDLGPLETNGGDTPTHRLKPGNPAIDNGVALVSPTKDQRGINRPAGSAFDVGAFEFVPCTGKPSKPALLSPTGNPQLATRKVALDWAGPDCAKTFSVVVRQNSKTGPIVFSKKNIKNTQVKTKKLANHTRYVWQVTACQGSKCATSKWGKFQVK